MTKNQDIRSQFGNAVTTVSGSLINHVRMLYEMAMLDLFSEEQKPTEINGYSKHVLPGYIIILAAVEAFINEVFLDISAEVEMKEAPLWKFPREWIEKIEISKKVILIPQLLFNKSLERDKQPFQDFALVVKIRNDLVHYKLRENPPKYIKDLDQRGILLKSPAIVDYPWPNKLSCSEGIRWAHNTACQLVTEIVSYAEGVDYILLRQAKNFKPITNTEVEKLINSISK